ncbi:MAG: Gfo/Idh/MocA family protein [Candidatus Cyclobacteriaceae bacterium M2_1C_046]
MKVLIIGLGSIAQKHINAFYNLSLDFNLFALRSGKSERCIEGVTDVFSWEDVPEDLSFIMICNPTSEHYLTVKQSLQFGVPLFIEKPPFMSIAGVEPLLHEIRKKNIRTYTAFNLRFHPLILWLKNNIKEKKVHEIQAYCGSYLPDWRIGRDYTKIYSAKKDLGGGVHLDLIHELDYLIYIFGLPEKSSPFFSKVSDLNIDSYDCAHYWMKYKNFNASIILNYYRKFPKRTIEIIFEDDVWNADLLDNKIINGKGEVIFYSTEQMIQTYDSQLDYFIKTLKDGKSFMNDIFNSVKTLELCLDEKYVE